MKITKLSNSFTIEYNGNTTQHGFNTLTAYVGKSRDSVTFKDSSQNIGCASIEEITINDTQMTSQNVETLLEELFFVRETGSAGVTYKAGNNISFTPNSDGSITISAKGDGGSSIIYISDSSQLPTQASLKDNAIVTTDGTPSGEVLEVYEYNGILWILTAFKPNLILPINTDFAEQLPYLFGIVAKVQQTIEKDMFSLKSLTGEPFDLGDLITTFMGVPIIPEVTNDFYFSNLNIFLTEKDSIISNLRHNNSLTVSDSGSVVQPLVKDKHLAIKDSHLSEVRIHDKSISQINFENLIFDPNGNANLDINEGNMNGVFFNRIDNVGGLTIYLEEDENSISKISRDIRLTDITTKPDGHLEFESLSNTKSLKDSFEFKNVSIPYEFMISNLFIHTFTMYDCDFTSLEKVDFSSLSFKDQATCDAMFSYLLDMSAGGEVFATGMSPNPSQSVQDALRAKGITLNIK